MAKPKNPHHREQLNGNDVLTRFLSEFALSLCSFHRRQNDHVSKISITLDSERSVTSQTRVSAHTHVPHDMRRRILPERVSHPRTVSHAGMDIKLQMADYLWDLDKRNTRKRKFLLTDWLGQYSVHVLLDTMKLKPIFVSYIV